MSGRRLLTQCSETREHRLSQAGLHNLAALRQVGLDQAAQVGSLISSVARSASRIVTCPPRCVKVSRGGSSSASRWKPALPRSPRS